MSDTHRVSDLLVIGAGPAGLAAAYRAAESGLQVTVVDDNPSAGGQIWRGEQTKPSGAARLWFERLRSAKLEMITGAHVFQHPGKGRLAAENAAGVREFEYANLLLATGARERFLPFPGWTLPNVMGAGGLQALVKSGLPIEGKRVVVAGSGPLLLAVAAYLRRRGAEVMLIAEQASSLKLAKFGVGLLSQRSRLSQAWSLRRELAHSKSSAQSKRPKFLTGCWVVEARGNGKLESVSLIRRGKQCQVACDYLACGFHLVPNSELAELLGCVVEGSSVMIDEYQQTSIEKIYSAGEATGIGGLELALVEGEIAGLAIAGKREAAQRLFATRARQRKFADRLRQTFALRNELKSLATPETIVCRCEDVVLDRLSGHHSWRAAKLQTRCGMGPCQGRVCGSAVEFLFGWRAESVRPPLLPVRIESLLSRGVSEFDAN